MEQKKAMHKEEFLLLQMTVRHEMRPLDAITWKSCSHLERAGFMKSWGEPLYFIPSREIGPREKSFCVKDRDEAWRN